MSLESKRATSVGTWLKEINNRDGSEFTLYDCDPVLMERYANYRIKEMAAAILTYHSKLVGLVRKDFEEHFGITTKTDIW